MVGQKVRIALSVGILGLLAACGTGEGAPDGWRVLEAEPVRVLHPKRGWTEVRGDGLGADLAAAVFTTGGRPVGRLSVRLTDVPPGPEVWTGQPETFRLGGRTVTRTEYTYRQRRTGDLVSGVDLSSPGGRRHRPILVRVTGVDGLLDPVTLRQIANSVTLE